MELIIENIRCFAGKHVFPIKPLTLLTGENSSGKSTFLAALATAIDPYGFPIRPRFNQAPYNLGSYDTIATVKGGRGGRSRSFSLGYSENGSSSRHATEYVAEYISNEGRIEVAEIVVKSDILQAKMAFPPLDEGGTIKVTFSEAGKVTVLDVPRRPFSNFSNGERSDLDEFFFYTLLRPRTASRKSEVDEDLLRRVSTLFRRRESRARGVLSIAPIRTKPKRTYDQVVEEFTPEGEHIPFVLSSMLSDPERREILERFGEESGLFKQIKVKQFGTNTSDPRQVMVSSSGPPANLIDVGYGVSQVLPIIVQSVLAASQSWLLLQQPEVHLHPRAQAALGSLFVDLMAKRKKQFVIETHSDYIIDRVRQEVAKGKIAAKDVGILYFEKTGNYSQVSLVSLDEFGNIVDAPPSYRHFFLQEELNLLTRTDAAS